MALVSSESFADSSSAGNVERYVQCARSTVHLAESAAPSGSDRLQASINLRTLEVEINKQLLNYCLQKHYH